MNVLDQVEAEQFRKKRPVYAIGDTVDVHVKIKEGEKERIQIFNGVVIMMKGDGLRETFTVRRIVQDQGVERIFPIHSPKVIDIVVKRKGKVRRAKLFFLRGLKGKATRLKEEVGAMREQVAALAAAAAKEKAEAAAQAAAATAAGAAAAGSAAGAAPPAADAKKAEAAKPAGTK